MPLNSNRNYNDYLLLNLPDNNSRGSSSTVANGCTSKVTIFLLQNTHQRENDSVAGGSDWMTQSDSTSITVELISLDVEEFHVGHGSD
jgi:hypothetical protein